MKRTIKKSGKKGFTLVELIVVLVILAIMAAILVPALTGYIDRAREQSITQEAATILTAAQACASEDYGLTVGKYSSKSKSDVAITAKLFDNEKSTIAFLTGINGDYKVTCETDDRGIITSFSVKDVTKSKVATWASSDGSWTVSDAA